VRRDAHLALGYATLFGDGGARSFFLRKRGGRLVLLAFLFSATSTFARRLPLFLDFDRAANLRLPVRHDDLLIRESVAAVLSLCVVAVLENHGVLFLAKIAVLFAHFRGFTYRLGFHRRGFGATSRTSMHRRRSDRKSAFNARRNSTIGGGSCLSPSGSTMMR
jgi:hypothetical protein